MKKVVVIGPESTGKSTLCAQLASTFRLPWVPEFARQYLSGLDRDYTQADLLEIARGQVALEDRICEENHGQAPLVFCDTDLYVIKVWSEHKYNQCHPWILQQIARRRYDLYLLTATDLPWVSDPLREYPSPKMRTYFFHVYQDIVQGSSTPWTVIHGDAAGRLVLAEAAVAPLVER